MVLHLAAQPTDQPTDDDPHTASHLLLFVKSCLSGNAFATAGQVAQRREAVQMAMVAFVLWPDAAFFGLQAGDDRVPGLRV